MLSLQSTAYRTLIKLTLISTYPPDFWLSSGTPAYFQRVPVAAILVTLDCPAHTVLGSRKD